MILCAGLTPAWQQILVFDGFHYGEVNRAVEAHWCASGKVFNAGIAAHHLGGPARTLTPLGGPPVEQIKQELDTLGMDCRFVYTAARTRVCTTILDRSNGSMTELVENGRPLSEDELDAFGQAFAEEAGRSDAVVLIGSLPAGTPPSYYRDLLQTVRCPAVLDFRGEGLVGVLDLEPYVIKPNRQELARTVGRPLPTDDELLGAMRSLNDRGAQWVVVTDGSKPVWMTSTAEAYRFDPPPVAAKDAVNPIGCGDAMAAAIAWATQNERPIVDAVRIGIAAAGDNLRQLLPCRLDPDWIEAHAQEVRVESA